MLPKKPEVPRAKAPTGIVGFDEITGGGLPRGYTTLLVGGPGSGKTLLGLQFLVHGARNCREPGILVAFEESSKRIVANASGFGWNPGDLQRKDLYFMDAQPAPDLIQLGNFDLLGMLAALEAQVRKMKARRIVFDALDVVLALLPDAAAKRREVYRLHAWLLAQGLTCLVTAKTGGDNVSAPGQFDFMQFMVDCVVILNHCVIRGVSQRSVRVQKYRGSGFDENESPLLIGKNGLEVAVARAAGRKNIKVSNERIASGVTRLDTMLGGGYYRGASILITGSPGTAKTTLSGAFAEAACKRGERTLFVSFDSDGAEVVRDLASVGIRLDRYVKNGCLRMVSARAITGSAETYLGRIKSLVLEHEARCLVVDPVSGWSRSNNDLSTHSVMERLTDWSKAGGITMLCTRLFDNIFSQMEGDSPLHISTLADTWIHLEYLVQAGERNRGLSIIKSRGTAHSNRMRELILSDTGVTLIDTCTVGGEVLMGTLGREKERAERMAKQVAGDTTRVMPDAGAAVQSEKPALNRIAGRRTGELSRVRTGKRELRGVDALIPGRK